MRRSLEAGLFVGGFLAVGVGVAHADSGGPPTDHTSGLLQPVTQLLGGSANGSSLADTVTGITGGLTGRQTPSHDVPTIPAVTTETSVAPAAAPEPTTTAAVAHVEGVNPGRSVTQPSGGSADMGTSAAPSSSASSSAAHNEGCGCAITTATPTVNQTAAGAPGAATAVVGQPADLAIPVYNSSDGTVSQLTASTSQGPLSCAATVVAAGGSTSCSGSYSPSMGSQSVPVVVSGTTAAGTVRTSGTAYLTGTTPAAAGGPDPGSPGSGKGSSCACELTTGTPAFDGTPAGSSKGPQVPAGQPGVLSVPVSNTGSQQVSGLTAQTSQGSLTCADTTLAPGGSTTCSGPVTPSAGDEVVPITVAGTTPDGPRSTTGYGYLNGTSGSTTPGGSTNPGGSTPGGSAPSGSITVNGVTYPVSSGSVTVGGASYPVAPDGTVSIGGVSYPVTSASGSSNPGGSNSSSGSITVNGVKYPVSNGSVTVGGASYPVDPDGTVTIGGTSYPVTPDQGSTTPGGSTPGGSNPSSGSITVNGVKYPVSNGSVTVGGASYPVAPDGTVTIGGTSYPVTPAPGGTGGTDGTGQSGHPLVMGAPQVNGKAAGSAGTVKVPAGATQAVAVTVTNTSDGRMSGIQGTAGSSAMHCSSTDLAPGESTRCTGRVTAALGDQSTPLEVTATQADGSRTAIRRSVLLTGVAPASVTGGGQPSTVTPAGNLGALGGIGQGVPSGSVVAGVPGPIQQLVNPQQGAFPMPAGPVAAGGGGTARPAISGDQGSDDAASYWAWSLLLVGGGAVVVAGSRRRHG